MNYEFCTRTDPGLARENNEDSVTVDEPTRLGILADGMGGYNAGEVASGMATTFIKSELGRWLAQAGRRRRRQDGGLPRRRAGTGARAARRVRGDGACRQRFRRNSVDSGRARL